ncbi:MAG TPA: 3-hydroxyacyl-CoA dehydrogenase NAD-binding domain-containing protein [Solirubrobacteraceae bacterium]|jgi:3-hydroxybutyryl-CoA dehydrogenase|nr:3-hydroxyacyl-CoA dehydrogenase NAD-binding domain-containing protein [Solirubrobacteraceae bacterium]
MSTTSGQVPEVIGVVGAGTMGAGIAQLAAQAGARTLLYDAVPEALNAGIEKLDGGLEHLVQRGRLTPDEAKDIRTRVEAVSELGKLAPCGIVIEAAPERIELKRELFRQLADVVGPGCVLATNTSSLAVTEIAAGTQEPGRVVGLHFFNPAPVMALVEVVAGAQSTPEALGVARAVGDAMGKRVIEAADVAGFLVNRCNRPFSLVSLRLLTERVAEVEQIDRIVRMEGGFRMGPFELQDLVGLDTNHAVAEAFQRQSYGEPRYQPSPLQARMVMAGRLGRKTGRGWYSYEAGTRPGQYRPQDPEPPEIGGGFGRVVLVTGDLPVAGELAEAAQQAGFEVRRGPGHDAPWLTLVCDGAEPGPGPRARLLHDGSLHELDPEAVGFHVVPPLAGTGVIELTHTPATDEISLERLRELIGAVGCREELVGDAPGLVLGRIVAQLINEAAFLISEGNGTPEDVDAGLELGLSHPRGPVAWSRLIGLPHVVAVLDALHRELGEERYRVAPLLRRRLALGAVGLVG